MEPINNQPMPGAPQPERPKAEWPNNGPEASPEVPGWVEAPAQQPAQSAPQSVQLPNIPDPAALQSAQPQPAPQAAMQPALPPQNPAEAADVDVIEKEWVDQADKIVEQTKNDPYVQEEAIEALQIDYLKKRYGHDVKKPDNTV